MLRMPRANRSLRALQKSLGESRHQDQKTWPGHQTRMGSISLQRPSEASSPSEGPVQEVQSPAQPLCGTDWPVKSGHSTNLIIPVA